MKHRRFLASLLGLALLVAVGAVDALAATTVALWVAVGPPTTMTRVKGSGFGAGEAIDVYFDATDEVLAVGDGTGAFSLQIVVPASATAGNH